MVRDVPESSHTHLEVDSLSGYQLIWDRKRRKIKRPSRYKEGKDTSCRGVLIKYAFSEDLNLEDYKPQSYEVAMSCNKTTISCSEDS